MLQCEIRPFNRTCIPSFLSLKVMAPGLLGKS